MIRTGTYMHYLLLLLVFAVPNIVLATNEYARENYNEAQNLKRANRFEEARQVFNIVADMDDADASSWAELAADELRYGLLMHEVNHLILKFGRSAHSSDKQAQYRQLAENKLNEIIDLNGDNVQRVTEAQSKLDQLNVSGAYVEQARSANTLASLSPIRLSIQLYYQSRGQWPDQRWLAAELKELLDRAHISDSQVLIKRYWRNQDKDYRLILLDRVSNEEYTITGDATGSRIQSSN